MADKVHSFGDDALGSLDAVGLAALVRARSVSPRELAEAAVVRAEKVDPHLNAIAFPGYTELRRIAEAKPENRRASTQPFVGVPTFVKDNVDFIGMPTGHGSNAVSPRAARRNSRFVEQFLSSGLEVLGKTRLPEFGFNAAGEFAAGPPVRNPWNTNYTAGASSSGAAALVAAGVVPIAHGNDGGGSIRIPAACCGLVGLKVTRGRFIPNEQAKQLPIDLVTEGVLTRSVRDTATFLAAAERYRPSKRLPPVGLVEGPSGRRLRVGLVLDSPAASPDEQTRAAVLKVAARLERAGHVVEPFDAPVDESFVTDFIRYWGMISFLVSSFGRIAVDRRFDKSKMEDLSIGLRRRFQREMYRAPGMLVRLKRVRKTYANAFGQLDLVLSPVLSHVTPPVGYLNPNVPFDELIARLQTFVAYTPANNIGGGPAISVPTGSSKEGMPIGVQFSAAHGDERTLLEIAYLLEAEQPWRRISD